MPDNQPITAAVVDMGSNTFHMVIANIHGPKISVIDRIREPVRLAAGFDDQRRFTPEAEKRALDCLQRFGERLQHIPTGYVRAVGTNAMRKANDCQAFLDKAHEMLGHPIQIVSGFEEARLIYSGVTNSIEMQADRRLLIDIGGGSTEVVVGEGYEPQVVESMDIGALSMMLRYFPDGHINKENMQRAVLAAGVDVQPYIASIEKALWEEAIGSSGSILAIHQIIKDKGLGTDTITYDALKTVRDMVIEMGTVKPSDFPSINPDRAMVFAGGLAILLGLFKNLKIDRMRTTEGGIREGVLLDIVGRKEHKDIRDTAVRMFSDRYGVDQQQALRVQRSALRIFGDIKHQWEIDDPELEQLLRWSARVHEVGLTISHGRYHRHSAYLVKHSDLPGFSREQQECFGFLVRAHRKKYPQSELELLHPDFQKKMVPLSIILRLAVLFRRRRSDHDLSYVQFHADKQALLIDLPKKWLKENPLAAADLEREREYLSTIGWELSLSASSAS